MLVTRRAFTASSLAGLAGFSQLGLVADAMALTAADVGCVQADGPGYHRFLYEDPHTQAIEFMVPTEHPAFIDKASLAQHAEVLRHSRSRHLELPCHSSRVHFAVANKLHDLEPSLVAQSPNLGQHGHLSILP